MSESLDLIEMGFLKSAVGVKGWFKIKAGTEKLDSLLQYPVWYIGNVRDGFHSFELENGFLTNNGLQAKLKGVNDRTVAERLRGSIIAIPRKEFLPTQENEYYWVDLIGMRVVNHRQETVGKVASLIETGANDVLVVSSEQDCYETLIPFVDIYIQSVDLERKIISVNWELDY